MDNSKLQIGGRGIGEESDGIGTTLAAVGITFGINAGNSLTGMMDLGLFWETKVSYGSAIFLV